jgi:hypothetical protein
MKIEIPVVDLRHQTLGGRPITDTETGKVIGQLRYGHQQERTVSLFDGKYQGTFDTHEQCWAFAKGVESVLNHMCGSQSEVPQLAVSQTCPRSWSTTSAAKITENTTDQRVKAALNQTADGLRLRRWDIAASELS